MIGAMLTSYSASGGELNFTPSAMPPGLQVERKVCEGFRCGGAFSRPVPASAKDGVKLCPACRKLARNAAIPQPAPARNAGILDKWAGALREKWLEDEASGRAARDKSTALCEP